MRGHEALVALRRRGSKPPLVWVLADGRNDGLRQYLRMTWGDGDTIEVEPSDDLARLDLRCLVDLVVDVTGTDEQRVAAVARACAAAGAKQVLAGWLVPVKHNGEASFESRRFTATNEELASWP